MSQKLLADGFIWLKDTFNFDDGFIKNCDEDSHIGYILEGDI